MMGDIQMPAEAGSKALASISRKIEDLIIRSDLVS